MHYSFDYKICSSAEDSSHAKDHNSHAMDHKYLFDAISQPIGEVFAQIFGSAGSPVSIKHSCARETTPNIMKYLCNERE
jgi:hypothetical protein